MSSENGRREGPIERLLAMASLPDEAVRDRKLWAFRLILMFHLSAGLGAWGLSWHEGGWRSALIAPMLVATGLVAFRRHERVGLLIALGCWAVKLTSVPLDIAPKLVANHGFLELTSLSLLLLLDPRRDEESELGLEALRWLTCIVFFWAGLQKVWHGTWFQGEYLAWNVSTGQGFQNVFGLILPDETMERLMSFRAHSFEFQKDQLISIPPGPYVVDSTLFVLAANVVWIVELLVPALLLFRRTRLVGLALGLGVLGAIELGALELFFGGLFANLLLLFVVRDLSRWLIPLFAVFYAVLLSAHLGLIPLEIPL